jgi:protein phosphatase
MTPAQSSISRYLWAAERQATWIPTDRLVENRYHVVSPQFWLDTKPQEPPDIVLPLPSQAFAYAQLYQYRLHIPQVYGFCSLTRAGEAVEIPLLENIPIDREGKLLPSLVEAWSNATPLYQAYWLWQAIDLWAPLAGTGVLASLSVMENLRVDGWCLRLCELIPDRAADNNKVTLAKLGSLWSQALVGAAPEIANRLSALFAKMQSAKASLREVSYELNRLVLERAAQLPLTWQIAGGTDAGTAHTHNEDSYYPTPLELAQEPTGRKIAIVCDGVAGHDGGEVASQMAVKLLKIQAQILCDDLTSSQEIVTPEQICNTIAAVIRVVNNTITAQNQSQGRAATQRMGTTMVMALQIDQPIQHIRGVGSSHEIYIAHVGDSRAYWITAERCQLLTIDDDIATREVKQGRDVPWHSASRPDAAALTQALGMKSGEMIHPTVQRFMAIEDGILLLCSDGLSDRDLVETSWQEYAHNIFQTGTPLSEAVQSWLALAHQQNGDDNISMVLMSCQVSSHNSQLHSSQIVPFKRVEPDLAESGSSSQSPLAKVISAILLVAASIGLVSAIVFAVGILRPDTTQTSGDTPALQEQQR